MVGAMLLRGRLRGPAWFAPPGAKSKSVSSLLRMKPPAMMRLPNGASTLVVMDATLPCASTMTKWLVPGTSACPTGAVRRPRGPMSFAFSFK